MATSSPARKGRESTLSFLNGAIEALNLAKEISSVTPAKAVFGSASVLLGMIKDSMVNEQDYVELGLSCADVCQALDRGLKSGRVDELTESMLGAIEKLTTTVAAIEKKIMKQGKRNPVSRLLHAKSDKDAIVAWGRDLDRILHIFNTELSMNNHMMLLELYRNALAGQGPTGDQQQPVPKSVPPGELPPPPPRACFGRDELIEKIVGLANNLNPIALTGAGGIGKTSVALTVLHHDHIKDRFGDNRYFIRCDEFPPSRTNFLSRLSKVIGAGVDNPEDLTPLRPSLSSKRIFLILDNGESIFDPQGVDGKEIYALVEELSRFNNICLVITSRITTIPPACKRLDVPPLTIDAARSAFYGIYDNKEQPEAIDKILEKLDYHPLSVTLLATVAHQNGWDNRRLVREWEKRRTGVLCTQHNASLAAAIELSIASPMFEKLGPDARGVLEVVAFFPQGVDEEKLEWLFPTISHRNTIFDRFCALSLAYRTNGFVTMLAPLRDHLRPRDPTQSPHLCAVKELYFTRLSVKVGPGRPGFDNTRWIVSEDVNVEHLLDVFTSVDPNSDDIWGVCADFMEHLYWHKPRLVVVGSKIEQLPDGHCSKPQCLFYLSRLFQRVGNWAERKRLLTHALTLYRERGYDHSVSTTLRALSDVNRMLRLFEEGIRQAREALEIQERLGDAAEQARCLIDLAQLLYDDEQLDAAEDAVSRTISLIPEKGEEFLLCRSHRLLGNIYRSKGDGQKAVRHYEEAIQIASARGWHAELFWIYYSLAMLARDEEKFDDAHAHIKQAKLHAEDEGYLLGRAVEMDAEIWSCQRMFEEATSEALHAIELYEEIGSAEDVARCGALLRKIEGATRS